MYLDKRQKELIKKSINDYEFMKVEIENFIDRTRTEDLQRDIDAIYNFILKFFGTEITNVENNNIEYAYLDFLYNDVNMCVAYDINKGNKIVVSERYEIYDIKTCEYIVEDWLTTNDYKTMIDAPKEDILTNMVIDLKCYDADGNKEEYDKTLEDIIVFLKEEY